MNYSSVYFSPTGTTKRIVGMIAKDLGVKVNEYDITDNFSGIKKLSFTKDDLVIIGIPVYSGRVPKLAGEVLSQMKGDKTPVVLVATYGNRHYDDSLLELKIMLQKQRFVTIAAAAFVTEHSVVQKFGKGRPNSSDLKIMQEFSEDLLIKINSFDLQKHKDLPIKGNLEYRRYKTIPIKPHALRMCNRCGLCACRCPANAISPTNPKRVDKKSCVTCMRCVRICPRNARGFYGIEKLIAEKSISKMCKEDKQPDIFI